jgi:hypothetical protein
VKEMGEAKFPILETQGLGAFKKVMLLLSSQGTPAFS